VSVYLKIIYYVTDHGLGHSTRAVAIIRELIKNNVEVIIRNNDDLGFFKKSLPGTKVFHGCTDFKPVMKKIHPFRFSEIKTKKNMSLWVSTLHQNISHEIQFLKKHQPDFIITDSSFMPILAANKNQIRSILLSNFVWSDSLLLSHKMEKFIHNSYSKADLVLQLIFGTKMKFKNKIKIGFVSRKPTVSKDKFRKSLGIKKNEKLVILSLSGMAKIPLNYSKNIKIIDISDYSNLKSSKLKNLVEGQNLINAADLVICKCGFGFITECLSNGVKFCYIIDSKHKEAQGIHLELKKLGLNQNITLNFLSKSFINNKFINNFSRKKILPSNTLVVKKIIQFYEKNL